MNVLIVSAFLAGSPQAGAVTTYTDLFSCENLLLSDFRRPVARLFSSGLDEGVAYVGLSPKELVGLIYEATTGEPAHLLLLKEHPAVRSGPSELRRAGDLDKIQLYAASLTALEKSAVELIGARLEGSVSRANLNLPVFREFLDNILAMRGVRPLFSPTFAQLKRAAMGLELPVAEPLIVEAGLSEKLQVQLNMGTEYWKLVGYKKLQIMATLLGIAWDNPADSHSPTRRQLESLFSDLPGRAGFIVSIKDSVLKKLTWDPDGHAVLEELELRDVSGIEPISQADYEFLVNLTRLN